MKTIVVQQWLLILGLVLAATGIVAGFVAWAQEREDDALEELRVDTILATVLANTETLNRVMTKPSARPLKFDACDGASVVEAMRAGGIRVKPQEFETRCEASRKN